MSWVRCPVCRTLTTDEEPPLCLGCGRLLQTPAGRPLTALEAPEVERTARRDIRGSQIVLAGTGALFIWGLASADLPVAWRALLWGVLALGGTVWAISAVSTPGPSFDTVGRVVIKLFALLGILMLVGTSLGIALLIYLLLTCKGM